MKKLFLNLFILTGLVLTTSCSSDDDDNNNSVELEGTWRLTAWNVGESYDLNNDGTASENLLDEFDCLNNETLVFMNGIATYMSTSYLEIYVEFGEGGESDATYTIECELEDEDTPATYTQNGNTISILTEDSTLVATLDGNTLSFVVPEGFYVEGDDFEVEIEQDLTYVFTKQ